MVLRRFCDGFFFRHSFDMDFFTWFLYVIFFKIVQICYSFTWFTWFRYIIFLQVFGMLFFDIVSKMFFIDIVTICYDSTLFLSVTSRRVFDIYFWYSFDLLFLRDRFETFFFDIIFNMLSRRNKETAHSCTRKPFSGCCIICSYHKSQKKIKSDFRYLFIRHWNCNWHIVN